MVCQYRFEWPASADTTSVAVTGNFDGWAQSTALRRNGPVFEACVAVPDSQKLVFKFVVNGCEWATSDAHRGECDEHGNWNNYVAAEDLPPPAAPAAVVETPPSAACVEEPQGVSDQKLGDAAENAVSIEPATGLASEDAKSGETSPTSIEHLSPTVLSNEYELVDERRRTASPQASSYTAVSYFTTCEGVVPSNSWSAAKDSEEHAAPKPAKRDGVMMRLKRMLHF